MDDYGIKSLSHLAEDQPGCLGLGLGIVAVNSLGVEILGLEYRGAHRRLFERMYGAYIDEPGDCEVHACIAHIDRAIDVHFLEKALLSASNGDYAGQVIDGFGSHEGSHQGAIVPHIAYAVLDAESINRLRRFSLLDKGPYLDPVRCELPYERIAYVPGGTRDNYHENAS